MTVDKYTIRGLTIWAKLSNGAWEPYRIFKSRPAMARYIAAMQNMHRVVGPVLADIPK